MPNSKACGISELMQAVPEPVLSTSVCSHRDGAAPILMATLAGKD